MPSRPPLRAMNVDTNDTAVTLRHGVVVSLAALRVLWALERRGLVIEREGDLLAVGPRSELTDDDRRQIRKHRDELLSLIEDELLSPFDDCGVM